ncbi:MAG: radical SAM protein [Bacteroidetes bacterium]|nr:radical SAM protein [Bacteroidota bacterium]
MANKILFTHSYFYRLDKKQWQTQKPYPPYATILAAAYLREKGNIVDLFDCGLQFGPLNIKEKLQSFVPDYLVIYDDSFNYLSKMCLSVMRDSALTMIQLAKTEGLTIIVSSSDATDHPEIYLNAGADIVIQGEAEETLHELIQSAGNPSTNCMGIAYVENGQIIKTLKRPVLENLDALPIPAWDLIEIDAYRDTWMKAHGYFSLNIATTRGCPFKCNWCAKPIYGKRYHTRSAEQVVMELAILMKDFNASHFWVCDDIFGLKPGWMESFSALLQVNKLKPKLKIQCRADLLIKQETVASLVSAGLDEVWIGAESGSQKILDAMDKGITIEQIFNATKLLKSMGVKVCLFIQYGYLEEKKSDIKKTLKMIKEIEPHDIGISVSYPLPGTGFYDKVKSLMKEKQNWTDSNDLETLYSNEFSKSFYRQLHLYTHYSFRNWKSRKMIVGYFTKSKTEQAFFKQLFVYNYTLAKKLFSKIKLTYYQLV